MIPCRYVKAPIKAPPEEISSESRTNQQKVPPALAKGMFLLGFLLIASVAWPLLSYELFTAPSLQSKQFLSPVPVLGQEDIQDTQTVQALTIDFTKPQNWFPQAKEILNKRESNITHYTLSIPKFDIENAVVQIGGDDLSKSLIHYPGSALPGEIGATVIFGHSVLPQFFNPKNYMSIFSLIPKMELGDEISIRFDGITYSYKVIDKIEVTPDNLSVLEQPFDSEYLRLITCTPPGTYLRRGVITARLVDL